MDESKQRILILVNSLIFSSLPILPTGDVIFHLFLEDTVTVVLFLSEYSDFCLLLSLLMHVQTGSVIAIQLRKIILHSIQHISK